MYTTAQDVHVAIMTRLYQVNTNRKGSFRPEEIDAAFNTNMFKFIEERAGTFKRDTSIENEIKLTDILSDLAIVEREVPVLFNNTSAVNKYSIAVLPKDYYKFEGLDLAINFDCLREISDVKTKSDTTIVSFLAFSTPATAADYGDLIIDIIYSSGTNRIYDVVAEGMVGINNVQSKFMLINNILEVINNTQDEVAIYWENYADIYRANNFILVHKYDSTYINSNILYGSTDESSTVIPNTTVTFDYESTDYTNIVPTELLGKKTFKEVMSNYYMAKNRWRKPIIKFTNNALRLYFCPKYIPIVGLLTYVKKPIMLNLKSDKMTDFTSHISEIIDLTVATLSLTLQGDAQALNTISNKNI